MIVFQEEKLKEYRRERKKEKKRKLEEEDDERDVPSALASVMGFSGFGSSKKK